LEYGIEVSPYTGVRFCLLGERIHRCAEQNTRCKQAFSDYRRGKEAVLESKWAKTDSSACKRRARRSKRVGIPVGGPVNVKDVEESTEGEQKVNRYGGSLRSFAIGSL
jgi:hypothetical protein